MRREKILCIDDNIEFSDMIRDYLQSEAYEVFTAMSAEDGLNILNKNSINLILLDYLLPETDGLSLLKQIRSKFPDMPVIMISGRAEDVDRIVGIESGADDYLGKPFPPRELSARIKAVLRRTHLSSKINSNPDQKNIIQFDQWQLDRGQFQVFNLSGHSACLTTNEFLVLDKLISSKNKALSREQLFALLRDTEMDVYDRAVDIQIARIRAKLKDNTKNPKYIKTIRNIGYMFCGDVNS